MKKFIKIFKNLSFLIILILAFVTTAQLSAQDNNLKFKHLSVNEGLSQSTVQAIMQDRKGFIWLGTRTGGLNKYDGYSFKVYKNDRQNSCSISGNAILSLLEDSKGMIWVGTRDYGLSKLNPETECFEQYYHDNEDEFSLEQNTVNDIFEDENGRVWIATNLGISYYNEEDNNFIKFLNTKTNTAFGHTFKILSTGNNILLIGTKSAGIFLINTQTGEVISNYTHDKNNPNSLLSNYITSLIYTSKGEIWAGTRKSGVSRLKNIDSQSFIQYKYNEETPSGISSNIIRTLHEDKLGNIWIGSKDGLDKLTTSEQKKDSPQFIHFKQDNNNFNSLIQNSIKAFLEDNRGNFWIGTWSGGVDYLNVGNVKFKHYQYQLNSNISLSNNVVSSFAVNNQGVWVGTEGGGLNLLDPKTNVFTHYYYDKDDSTSLQSNHVKALYIDSDGDLWVGTFNGLHLYNKYSNNFKQFIPGSSIYSIIQGEGDDIWIGTANKLFRLKKSTFNISSYTYDKDNPTTISNKTINVVHRDKENNIWVGTKTGLNLYNKTLDNFIAYRYSKEDINSISNDYVSSICEDMSGNLWIGTQDGLNKFDRENDSFIHFGENDGLPDNVINSLLSDGHGNLWITTNKGLSKFSPNISGNRTELKVRNYDANDGLQGNEFILNAAYKSAEGDLYFGGINGFNVFNPDKIEDNQDIPNVVITEFKLFNKNVEIGKKGSPLKRHISNTKKLKLNHKQSVISFGFVALNYISSEKNQYAYMMDGFDEDWNFVGTRREASYTNLPAGNYTFRVIASNNDGIWNLEGTSIKIIVRPPWWKTTLFYIVVFILLSSAVYLFIKAREQQNRRDRERLEAELSDGKKEIIEQQKQVEQQQKELKRKEESERAIKWHNKGFIMLTNLISEKRHDLELLANSLVFELVNYIDVQMGAIYFANKDGNKEELKLKGGYALDSKRLNTEIISAGEGLVGTCYKNKETMRIDSLPSNYASLDSGLGNSNLSNLILIPIKYEDSIEGVIELIAFQEISKEKVKLIEEVCQNLGAALINEKANEAIQKMLNESKTQQETLSAHEEELRQNIEELAATQEESSKKEEMLIKKEQEYIKVINKLKKQISNLKKV